MQRREFLKTTAATAATLLGIRPTARAGEMTLLGIRPTAHGGEAQVAVGDTTEVVKYDILGMQEGVRGKALILFYNPLLIRTGEIYRDPIVEDALVRNGFEGVIMEDPLHGETDAMTSALTSKVIIDADPRFGPKQSVIPFGPSSAGPIALNAAVAFGGDRVPMVYLLSPQADLGDPKVRSFLSNDQREKMEAIYYPSRPIRHRIAMSAIRSMAKSPQAVYREFIKDLSASDVKIIEEENPELKRRLLKGFECYCNPTPSPNGSTVGEDSIIRDIRRRFKNTVPYAEVPKSTKIRGQYGRKDPYVNRRNSVYIEAKLKEHGHNDTKLTELPDEEAQFWCFREGGLAAITEEIKTELSRPAVAMHSSAGGVQHNVLDKDD